MLEERFKVYFDKIGFFEVGDLPLEEPKQAMDKLAILIEILADQID